MPWKNKLRGGGRKALGARLKREDFHRLTSEFKCDGA